MIAFEDLLPVAVAATLVANVWLARKVSAATQPLRLELADRAERLMAQNSLPDEAKEHLSFLLDTVFGMRAAIFFGYFAVPLLALSFVFQSKHLDRVPIIDDIEDPLARREFRELSDLHDKITLMNNPLMFIILWVEMVIFLLPATVLGAAIRGIAPRIVPSDAFFAIEGKFLRLRARA